MTDDPLRIRLADADAPPGAVATCGHLAAAIGSSRRRRLALERLRGRVAVRLPPAGGEVGLVLDRGAVTVWDGPPPAGAELVVTVPDRALRRLAPLVAASPAGGRASARLAARLLADGVRVRGGLRHPLLAVRLARLALGA